jgi:hypothetical protein
MAGYDDCLPTQRHACYMNPQRVTGGTTLSRTFLDNVRYQYQWLLFSGGQGSVDHRRYTRLVCDLSKTTAHDLQAQEDSDSILPQLSFLLVPKLYSSVPEKLRASKASTKPFAA